MKMMETKLGRSLAGAAVTLSLCLTKRLLLSYDACLDQCHEGVKIQSISRVRCIGNMKHKRSVFFAALVGRQS